MKKNRWRRLRNQLGLSQQAFWSRLGITQSGGSRYESGRIPPKPVRMLADLAYGNPNAAGNVLAKLRSKSQ